MTVVKVKGNVEDFIGLEEVEELPIGNVILDYD